MLVVDTHCDTAERLLDTGEGLYANSLHADLKRMSRYKGYVQLFAAFVDDALGQAYALRRALCIIDGLYREADINREHMRICLSFEDIRQALEDGKVAGLISIENGLALQGEPAVLRMLYRLGVRSICLTWNGRNELADGVRAGSDGGLTEFGREVVREMDALGMLADVSHISVNGFWDVIETSRSVVSASHSNARKICDHPRNLYDDQLLAIAETGGVIGVNFYPYFLNGTDNASKDDIIRHIEYIAGLSGIDHVGFGADFDGIGTTPRDVKGVQDLGLLLNELAKLNYTESAIKKIAGENHMRVFERVLSVGRLQSDEKKKVK